MRPALDVDDIDPVAVLNHLGWSAVEHPAPIEGGWDTLLFRFETEDGELHALRVYREPESREPAQHETVALEHCSRAGFPVPALEAVGEWRGLPVKILRWAPGLPLVDALPRRPWMIWRLAREYGRLQARLNAMSPPEELVDGAPDYWLDRSEESTKDVARLVRTNGCTIDRFVHLDFHPLNVLADGTGVTAVIDWTNAAAGDPRADFARTAAIIRTGPIPPGPLRWLLALGRRLMYEGWKQGYEAESGPLEGIAPFMAWAAEITLADYEGAIEAGRGWIGPDDLGIARRWVSEWRTKAGMS